MSDEKKGAKRRRRGRTSSHAAELKLRSTLAERTLPEQGYRRFDWTTGLTTRAANALRAYGFTSREQVAMLKDAALLRIAQIGPLTLAEIRRWLGQRPSID